MKTRTRGIIRAWLFIGTLCAGCGGGTADHRADALVTDAAPIGDALSPMGGEDGDAEVEVKDADIVEDAGLVSACRPRVRTFAPLASPHILPAGYDPAAYNSNPPSSGPHCTSWGQYTSFTTRPLPRCNYIHNLEHGAVVLLFNCPTGCPEVTTAFHDFVANYRDDPFCLVPRLIVTPDADLSTKVAASAWGATFTADCLDAPARALLAQFARDHQNKAPEDVCAGGGVVP